MRDDTLPTEDRSSLPLATSATILHFPTRITPRPITLEPASGDAVAALLAAVIAAQDHRIANHRPTLLASVGAVAGFAAQQSLLLDGGHRWLQPNRAKHLDRLLLSADPTHASLWRGLQQTATGLGVKHLPNPGKLLEATLRCVGTNQFGVIILPLNYRLVEQPQTTLLRVWAQTRNHFDRRDEKPAAWPSLAFSACTRRIVMDQRQVPPHVAVRIIMQSALAMALIEPKLIPGAALKPDAL